MKKVNCKKGLSALMAATMGLSMFAATGAGVTNATRGGGIFNNVNKESAIKSRDEANRARRNQRRNDLMNERRGFSIGFFDVASSFFGARSDNALRIKNILMDYSRSKNYNLSEQIAVIIANKLDSAGFDAMTIANILAKLSNELQNYVGIYAIETCFKINKHNFQAYAKKVFDIRNIAVINDINSESLYKDALIHMCYDMKNGVAYERSDEDKKLVFQKTMEVLNYIEGLIKSYIK